MDDDSVGKLNAGTNNSDNISGGPFGLNNKLNSLQKVLFNIEKKTSSLSKKNLDLDLLDEQSRKILGLIRHDEIMLIEK